MEYKKTPGHSGPNASLPIVGIGASAGGLYALKCFLAVLPKDFGFSMVFLQHLSPTHRSLLPELLAKGTPHLEILEITNNMEVLPGQLFLCPPGKEIKIQKGRFQLIAPKREHVHLPIDEFFISLAEEAEDRAIAVILSGAGTDGARGTQAIRSSGGTVFVQDPSTAEFPGMPLAAISTGQVDEVLRPEDIAREIVKLTAADAVRMSHEDVATAAQFETFYGLIRQKTGYRFNHYKQSVVNRRIRRRMYLSGVTSVQDYIQVVTDKDQEASALASDLMIGVTSFFRDQLAWRALKVEVIRHLVAGNEDAPVRVWSPACASGEEAYSIAMLLHHELALAGKKRELQVFATDVNDRALEKAREGSYPASIAADVPADLMRKYFTFSEDGQSVVISKEIRECVVFAKQDLMTDPPFSRLDLVICRNFLIYLEPEAQEKSIALFHYALKDNGYLFLGNAESTGRNSVLFRSLGNKKCRVYRKLERTASTRLSLSVPFAAERAVSIPSRQALAAANQPTLTETIQNSLLEEYAPASIAINHNYDILYHNGPTNNYLHQPRGVPTQNLLFLLPENLRSRVRGAIYRAAQEAGPVSIRVSFPNDGEQAPQSSAGKKTGKKSTSSRKATKKGAPASAKGGKGDALSNRTVTLRISKLRENIFVLVFQEKRGILRTEEPPSRETAPVDETVVRQLESELSATRADLQTNIEQLKGLNEELQSSNEELQAANEELETSREELQSLNEELLTVNTQLQAKIEEQDATNNDLNNFLTSTNIPTIFLDHRFRVKRFTPAMSKLLKLIPSDVGRPIIDMSQDNLGTGLIADAQSVLENLVPIRKEIAVNDVWYIRATLPYRTTDNRIEGVVVTYTDITERKRDEEIKGHLSAIVESADEGIISKDLDGVVQTWNAGAEKIFGYAAHEAVGRNVSFLIPPGHVDEVPAILKRIAEGEHIEHFETERMCKDGSIIPVSLTFSPIRDARGRVVGVSKICHDISARKKAEERIKHLASFPQLNPNPICEVDPTGTVAFCNPAAIKILTDLELDNGDISLFLPADIEEILKDLEKKNEALLYREVVIRGRIFSETVHLAPQFNVVRIYAFDITERKKAEEDLKKSEELFRLAMDNMPDAIAIYDAERRYEFINAAGLRRVGKPLEVFVGRRLDEMYDEKTRSAFWPVLMRTYETGTSQTVETSLTMPTGQYDLILTFVPMLKDGRVYRVLNFTFDITERKRAEEALRLSEEKFSLAFANNPAAIALTRLEDGLFLDVNDTWLVLNGYSRDEVIGRSARKLPIWPTAEAAARFVQELREKGVLREWEQEFLKKSGEVFAAQLSAQVLTVRGERVILSTFVDITERKKHEAQLVRQANLLDLSSDAICVRDAQDRITFWSDGAETIYGYTREDVLGKVSHELLRAEFTEPLEQINEKLKKDGRWSGELIHTRRDGSRITVSSRWALTLGARGNPSILETNSDITERKQVEAALRESEERFRLLVEQAVDGIFLADAQGRYIDVNTAGARMLGYTQEEVCRLSVTDVLSPADLARMPSQMSALASGSVTTNEWLFCRKDGSTFIGEVVGRQLPDGRLLGILRDITARKQAEEALKEGERRYHSLFENMVEGFAYCKMLYDDSGQAIDFIYLEVNNAFARLTGLTGVVGKKVTEVIPGIRETDPELFRVYGRVASSCQSERMEFYVEALRMWFSLSVYCPQKEYFVAVFDVITDRKRAEEALRESEVRFKAIFENSIDAVGVSKDGRHVLVNPSYFTLFGYSSNDELSGKPILDLIAPAEREKILEYSRTREKEGAVPRYYETRGLKKDGTEFIMDVNVETFSMAAQTYTLVILRDVTERKKAEADIMKLSDDMAARNLELESANKEMEAFIYSVSHDLRAPLRTMSGFSKILMEDFGAKLEDQPKDYLKRITNASEKMTELIEDLLRLSRISKQDMDRVDYDLSRLASSISTGLREQDPGRKVDFAVADGLHASVDPNLIRVAFANLIENAWKFTSRTTNARIEFNAFEKDGKTVYYVKDNGAGFDMTYANKMFLPFQRLHTEKEFEGTGIGLAIVERIIRRHNGTVWAEGEVGKGATIFFTLG